MPRTATPRTPAQNLADAQALLEFAQTRLETTNAKVRAALKKIREAQKAQEPAKS